MLKVIISILSIGLVGCAALGMPGAISERVSGFDNMKEIVMEPGFVQNGLSGDIKLGLSKTSKMEVDKATLNVVVRGMNRFSVKDSLQFNIDGEIITLKTIDAGTKISIDPAVYGSVVYLPPTGWSSQRYEITKELIKRLIDGKKVWVKVNLSSEYVEGNFSEDNPSAARPAFRKFYSKVWGAE